MQVIEATMLTHGKVGFASREVGRMADTEPCVLNTALHYALGLASGRYVDTTRQPTYIEDTAEVVNDLYVTPAIPTKANKKDSARASFITTIRNARGDDYATPNYSAKDDRNEKAGLNVPVFERERALSPGNLLRFYVFPYGRSVEEALEALPRYIRLGKKRGKARVEYRIVDAERRSGSFSLGHPISIYDHEARPTGGVVMKQIPPTPLVYEGEFDTDHYAIESPFSERASYESRVCYPADAKFLLRKRNDA